MSSKLMSADEKRNRKNEMARIRRANGKQNSVVDTEIPEPDNVPEPDNGSRLEFKQIKDGISPLAPPSPKA